MNASLLCLLAALSANGGTDDGPIYQLTKPFETTVVAQGNSFETPIQSPGVVPNGGFVDPFVGGFAEDQTGYGFYAGYESVFLKPHFSSDRSEEHTSELQSH